MSRARRPRPPRAVCAVCTSSIYVTVPAPDALRYDVAVWIRGREICGVCRGRLGRRDVTTHVETEEVA